ncbi:hypothetical protein LTR66_013081, partial [Elasticomyces elasticus]
RYAVYYNAAAHVRRAHFRPRKRGRRPKGEVRVGLGEGEAEGRADEPKIEWLKKNGWLMELSGAEMERSKVDEDEEEEEVLAAPEFDEGAAPLDQAYWQSWQPDPSAAAPADPESDVFAQWNVDREFASMRDVGGASSSASAAVVVAVAADFSADAAAAAVQYVPGRDHGALAGFEDDGSLFNSFAHGDAQVVLGDEELFSFALDWGGDGVFEFEG